MMFRAFASGWVGASALFVALDDGKWPLAIGLVVLAVGLGVLAWSEWREQRSAEVLR